MFILFNNFSHRRRECVGSYLFKRVEQYSNINFGFVYTETEGSFASKKNLISNWEHRLNVQSLNADKKFRNSSSCMNLSSFFERRSFLL